MEQAAYSLSQAEATGSALEASSAAALMSVYAIGLFLFGLVATRRRDIG